MIILNFHHCPNGGIYHLLCRNHLTGTLWKKGRKDRGRGIRLGSVRGGKRNSHRK